MASVSGINLDDLEARRRLKPGLRGQMKASEFFAMQKEAQAMQSQPEMIAQQINSGVLEAIHATGLTPESEAFPEFIEGVKGGLRRELKDNKNNKKMTPDMIEGMKLAISRLEKLSDTFKKEKVTERTEKIVTRVEKLANDDKKSKTLEREEKLVKKEEELVKQTKQHQKKAEELIVKREKLMGFDEKQFKLRGKLVEMEMKQRALYNTEIAPGDTKSNIMFQSSKRALEIIGRMDQESVDQEDKQDKDMIEILTALKDTLRAMAQAPLSEHGAYQEVLTRQLGSARAIANDPDRGPARRAFGQTVGQYEHAIERNIKKPGTMRQLGDWGKNYAKETATNLWEQNIPMPLRIIAEGAFKGLRSFGKDSKKQLYAESQYAYNQNKIERVRDRLLEGSNESFVEVADTPISLSRGKKSRSAHPRVVARGEGRQVNPRPSSESSPSEMHVEKIVVGTLDIAGQGGANRPSLADAISKEANDVKKGKGIDLAGLFSGFLGKLGMLFGGFGAMFMGTLGRLATAFGPLIGILTKALPLLGGAALVGGAAVAGYAVGSAINSGANWVAEKITGRKGETAQSAILAGVDKLQDKAGGMLGKSSGMEMKEGEVKASTKRFDELLKLQGGEMTSKQVDFWKKQGVNVSAAKINENVTVLGPDNKPIEPRKAVEAALVTDVIPKNQSWPDESPAEKARMASGGKNSALAAPSAAIHQRTNMVDAASRQIESSKEVRGAKPMVVVNNVGGGEGGKMQAPPISLGAARNQENAFARYLASNFAAM